MASITRKQGSHRTERKQSVQSDLLGALDRLLDNGQSYTELSVERLVAEAGLSRSTFYAYFEDKGDLLSALAEDVIVEIRDAGRSWWELPPDAGKSDVRAALWSVSQVYREHRAVFRAVVDTATYDARVREQFGTLVRGVVSELADHIRNGQKRSYVKDGLDPDRTAAWLTWMAERGLNQLVADAGEEEAEELVGTLADIVWNTLYEGAR